MKKTLILAVVLSIIIPGCLQENGAKSSVNETIIQASLVIGGETAVELKTSDGMKIAGTHYKSPSNSGKGIILLHMLGRNRSDWNEFARKLQYGYDVLTIDFRGHGESGGELPSFAADDFQKFKLDVAAAKNYLEWKGAKLYAIIGGSIGANVALNFGADNDVPRLVLLSPGMDYRGVKAEDAARKYAGKLLLVASEDDAYSANSVRKLVEHTLAEKTLKIYRAAGHGTRMFASTDLDDLIVDWLRK